MNFFFSDSMRKRRDDIPALYSEISRDDSVSLANIPPVFDSQNLVTSNENSQNSVQEFVEKSQENVQKEEEPKSTGSGSTGTGNGNLVELQSVTNEEDDITAKTSSSTEVLPKESILSEIDSENSSQGMYIKHTF